MPTPVAGTGPVVAISAGIQESFALLEGRLPMPSLVRLTPEREALRITWTTRPKELHLRYSVRGTGAWSPMVYPAEGTSSYVFAQLAGEEYEVEFNAEGKKRFLRATPLA